MNICFSLIIYYVIEAIHFLFLFIPILFYIGFLKNNTLFRLIFIIILMTPMHWIFFNDKCILTIMSNYVIDSKSNRGFMDKYFSKIFNYLSKKTNTPKDQLYTKYVNYFIIIST